MQYYYQLECLYENFYVKAEGSTRLVFIFLLNTYIKYLKGYKQKLRDWPPNLYDCSNDYHFR